MKYALVTGASRGIGREVSVKLAEMGYFVIVNYVANKAAAEQTLELVREAGSDGEIMQFDVADADSVAEKLTDWQERNKGENISVLVNNAGVRDDELMMWMGKEKWSKVVDTSLDGFFNVTQPLLKDMLTCRFGRIINVTSLSGIKGLPGQVNYSAGKGGVIAATKALAQEVAKRGVTVNAVAPGYIKTEMTQDLSEADLKKFIPAGRFGEAREVAELVGFLASESSSYITGEVISINGGLYT